jgi:hypothetical protein
MTHAYQGNAKLQLRAEESEFESSRKHSFAENHRRKELSVKSIVYEAQKGQICSF